MADRHPSDLSQDHQVSETAVPQDPQACENLIQLAKIEPLTDGGIRTSQLLADTLSLAPHHHEAHVLQERLHQMLVPRWHFPMLADKGRNSAYAKAIAAKVRPGDIVLDIGCGAGLTAMLAARAGAKHVYTCEQQPLIAQAAQQVVEDNGLSDRITVIPKMSHNLIIGEDIPEPADVVISEIVDGLLLGEGALATLTHAMSALAKPNARAIPEQGKLMAQPVESEKLIDLWRPHEAEGFDLAAFHRFARVAQITPNDFAVCGLHPLGAETNLFQFDFTNPSLKPARTSLDLTCDRDGVVHAVLVSFALELAPGIVLTNGLHSDGHWGRTAFFLDRPESVKLGHRLTITAQHDSAQLSLSVHNTRNRAEQTDLATGWLKRALDLPDHEPIAENAANPYASGLKQSPKKRVG